VSPPPLQTNTVRLVSTQMMENKKSMSKLGSATSLSLTKTSKKK